MIILQKKSRRGTERGEAMKVDSLYKGERKQYEQCRAEIVRLNSKDVVLASVDNLGGWKDDWLLKFNGPSGPFIDNENGGN